MICFQWKTFEQRAHLYPPDLVLYRSQVLQRSQAAPASGAADIALFRDNFQGSEPCLAIPCYPMLLSLSEKAVTNSRPGIMVRSTTVAARAAEGSDQMADVWPIQTQPGT